MNRIQKILLITYVVIIFGMSLCPPLFYYERQQYCFTGYPPTWELVRGPEYVFHPYDLFKQKLDRYTGRVPPPNIWYQHYRMPDIGRYSIQVLLVMIANAVLFVIFRPTKKAL